jgi:hypothetical protein
MRFLRHDGIYRSDVSLLLVNPAQMPPPVGRPRCQAIARDGRSTPCPSSAMSSGRLFLDRGGRHQSPSPLHQHPQNSSLAFRRARIYHRTAGSVLTVCVSRGDKRSLRVMPEFHSHPQRRPAPGFARRSGFPRPSGRIQDLQQKPRPTTKVLEITVYKRPTKLPAGNLYAGSILQNCRLAGL